MFNARIKTVTFALLLTLLNSQLVCAGTKVYRYDGKLPFIEMMLGMMDAMGVIDKMPNSGAYGYGGYPSSPWAGASNPYTRSLAMRGLRPGTSTEYFNNPFTSSPWSQSPWTQGGSQDGLNAPSPMWGSPDWGVLPIDNYSRHYYDTYGYGYQPYWSQSDLDDWVSESWETSEWNSRADVAEADRSRVDNSNKAVNAQRQRRQPGKSQNAPLVQNFNFSVTERPRIDDGSGNRPDNRQVNRQQNRSPLAKLAQPRLSQPRMQQPGMMPPQMMRPQTMQHGQADRPSDRSSTGRPKQPSPLAKKSYRKPVQKPCVTEFCGLKKPNINGLWVAESGEMLGVKNKRYLWSDGQSRYLTGQIKIQNEYLVASVDDSNKIMRFKYKLAGNHLLTMQADGTIREFVRTPMNQYYRYR